MTGVSYWHSNPLPLRLSLCLYQSLWLRFNRGGCLGRCPLPRADSRLASPRALALALALTRPSSCARQAAGNICDSRSFSLPLPLALHQESHERVQGSPRVPRCPAELGDGYPTASGTEAHAHQCCHQRIPSPTLCL